MKEAEDPNTSFDALKICDPFFESLDLKLGMTLSKILEGELKHELELMEKKEDKEGRFLRGRQIYRWILNQYKSGAVQDFISDFTELTHVQMIGNNIERFDQDWEECLLKQGYIPDNILEALYRAQVKKHPGFADLYKEYHYLPEGDSRKTYKHLRILVQTYKAKNYDR